MPWADAADRLRSEYGQHPLVLRADHTDTGDELVLQAEEDYPARHLAVIARKRAAVLRIRDEHYIDDTVLRQVQTQLDIDETWLSRHEVE